MSRRATTTGRRAPRANQESRGSARTRRIRARAAALRTQRRAPGGGGRPRAGCGGRSSGPARRGPEPAGARARPPSRDQPGVTPPARAGEVGGGRRARSRCGRRGGGGSGRRRRSWRRCPCTAPARGTKSAAPRASRASRSRWRRRRLAATPAHQGDPLHAGAPHRLLRAAHEDVHHRLLERGGHVLGGRPRPATVHEPAPDRRLETAEAEVEAVPVRPRPGQVDGPGITAGRGLGHDPAAVDGRGGGEQAQEPGDLVEGPPPRRRRGCGRGSGSRPRARTWISSVWPPETRRAAKGGSRAGAAEAGREQVALQVMDPRRGRGSGPRPGPWRS